MKDAVLSVRKYKVGYEIRTERYFVGDDEQEVIIKSAYTIPEGHYIGSSKDAHYLIVKRGIKPELSDTAHSVCSIGFCEREQKWAGWSHRAICHFGIGDRIFEECYGDDDTLFTQHGRIVIETLDQAKRAAINFAESVS